MTCLIPDGFSFCPFSSIVKNYVSSIEKDPMCFLISHCQGVSLQFIKIVGQKTCQLMCDIYSLCCRWIMQTLERKKKEYIYHVQKMIFPCLMRCWVVDYKKKKKVSQKVILSWFKHISTGVWYVCKVPIQNVQMFMLTLCTCTHALYLLLLVLFVVCLLMTAVRYV